MPSASAIPRPTPIRDAHHRAFRMSWLMARSSSTRRAIPGGCRDVRYGGRHGCSYGSRTSRVYCVKYGLAEHAPYLVVSALDRAHGVARFARRFAPARLSEVVVGPDD